VTVPHAGCGRLEAELKKCWTLAAKYAGADLVFYQARRSETHGMLLERLWCEARDDDDRHFVLSEIDFIPRRQGLVRLAEIDVPFVGVNYVTRIPDAEGKLHKHELPDGVPLIGPWLLSVRLDGRPEPPDNWLAAAGPFNDAANLALQRCLESGFCTIAEVDLLRAKDDRPLSYGVRYPHIGRHLFYGSSLEKPADQVICFRDTAHPLTAGQVQDAARTCLKVL